MSIPLVKNGQTILFIGDSITDCGRRAAAAPLGDGYVKIFTETVTVRQPDLLLNVLNKGIGGNKIDDLKNRWQDDVMDLSFDWLSMKIGINDIHRQLREPGAAFSVKQFAEDCDAVLAETTAKKDCRIILIDPFYLSTDRSGASFRSEVLQLLDEYLSVTEELAGKYGAVHLKTQDMFQRCLKNHEPDELCAEPVHPYRAGHLAIALELYKLLLGEL